MSNSLWPHELRHARPPCPSPPPRVYPNSCPLSWWCHPTTSSSVIPFSSCSQSFPTSGSFQMSQLFASGGQSIGVSASTSVLPMNTQDWSPLRWTGWISLQSKKTLKSLLQPHSSKASVLWFSAFFIVQLSHPYMPSGSIHTVTSVRFLFFKWQNSIPLCIYIHIYYIFSIHSSIDGYIDCFHTLAIINNVAMKMGCQISIFFQINIQQ